MLAQGLTDGKLVQSVFFADIVPYDDVNPDVGQSVRLAVVQFQRGTEGVSCDGQSLLDTNAHLRTHPVVTLLKTKHVATQLLLYHLLIYQTVFIN